MKRNLNQAAALALALTASMTSALAADTTSTANAGKSGLAKAMENVSAIYAADYFGAAFSSMDTGTTPIGTASSIRSTLQASYKFANGMTLAPSVRFQNPVAGESKSPFMDQVSLKLAQPKLLSRGNLNLSGDVRALGYLLPFFRQQQNRAVGFASKQALTYVVGKSPVTLGIVNYIETATYSGPGQGKQKGKGLTWLIDFVPYVDVQVLPTLVASTQFGLDAGRMRGQTTEAPFLQNLGTYLDLGVAWDITPTLNFNPYVDLASPGDGIRTATTSVNASLTWRML